MANSGGITCYTFLKQNCMEILKKLGNKTRKIVEVKKICFPAKFWAYTGKSGFGHPNHVAHLCRVMFMAIIRISFRKAT